MPRGEWDTVLLCLRELMNQGWILKSTYSEISEQVDQQEY